MITFYKIAVRLVVLMLYFVALVLIISAFKAHADTEIWGIENVGKDKIKIELNVDGCITSFTVPKVKFEQRDDVMDSMLAMAEERQKLGCR